jgi:hypothetical protein
LADKIRRKFGYPVVKVELDQRQIYDAIDEARGKFIKWAVGQATQEVFFTMALSAGQTVYELPLGITTIVDYNDKATSSGINTLFSVDNYLYNQGFFDSILWPSSNSGYNLISYHIALDFLDTIKKYTPTKYNWKYHHYQNELEIQPPPPSGGLLSIEVEGTEFTINSPGYVLLHAYMIEGSTNISNWSNGDSDQDFYDTDWIFEYTFADCKERIGYIRRKFENFASIGNTGISLDGSDMINEAKEEKETLLERLKDEEPWDGWGILIGY